MFVQSERFVEEHGGRLGDIAIYGQESNYTTWRLAKMNLAVRGIDADIRWNNEGSFHKDELKDLRFDYILANPPSTLPTGVASGCARTLAGNTARRRSATPIMPGFSISSGTWPRTAPPGWCWRMACRPARAGKEIRRAMVEGDVVDCMIALPGQLFYSTQIPACLWFLA